MFTKKGTIRLSGFNFFQFNLSVTLPMKLNSLLDFVLVSNSDYQLLIIISWISSFEPGIWLIISVVLITLFFLNQYNAAALTASRFKGVIPNMMFNAIPGVVLYAPAILRSTVFCALFNFSDIFLIFF